MSSSRRIICDNFRTGSFTCGNYHDGAAARGYRGTYQSVRNLITRIENRATTFQEHSRRCSGSESNSTEPTLRTTSTLFVRDFDAAVDRLRQRFESRQSTAADAQEVLNHAAFIDRFVNRRRLDDHGSSKTGQPFVCN